MHKELTYYKILTYLKRKELLTYLERSLDNCSEHFCAEQACENKQQSYQWLSSLNEVKNSYRIYFTAQKLLLRQHFYTVSLKGIKQNNISSFSF